MTHLSFLDPRRRSPWVGAYFSCAKFENWTTEVIYTIDSIQSLVNFRPTHCLQGAVHSLDYFSCLLPPIATCSLSRWTIAYFEESELWPCIDLLNVCCVILR